LQFCYKNLLNFLEIHSKLKPIKMLMTKKKTTLVLPNKQASKIRVMLMTKKEKKNRKKLEIKETNINWIKKKSENKFWSYKNKNQLKKHSTLTI